MAVFCEGRHLQGLFHTEQVGFSKIHPQTPCVLTQNQISAPKWKKREAETLEQGVGVVGEEKNTRSASVAPSRFPTRPVFGSLRFRRHPDLYPEHTEPNLGIRQGTNTTKTQGPYAHVCKRCSLHNSFSLLETGPLVNQTVPLGRLCSKALQVPYRRPRRKRLQRRPPCKRHPSTSLDDTSLLGITPADTGTADTAPRSISAG